MKIQDTPKGYQVWAKKGDVWSNTAHLIKSGENTTLCGKFLLGNNYKDDVKEIGCKKCLECISAK